MRTSPAQRKSGSRSVLPLNVLYPAFALGVILLKGLHVQADYVHSQADQCDQTTRQWRVPRKNDHGAVQAKAIQPGDSGIWATCNKGKEAKCIGELRDLFTDYAEELYGDALANDTKPVADDKDDDKQDDKDIESEIQAEVSGIQRPPTAQLFSTVRLNVQCGQ